MDNFLKANLQFFADGDNEESGESVNTPPVDDDEVKDEVHIEHKAEARFSQEDMDKLAAKIRREEKEKQERKTEQEREAQRQADLEKNEEYKTLLDEAREEINRYKEKEKAVIRDNAVKDALRAKGLSDEQVRRYSKYVVGSSEEEINESIDIVYNDFIVSSEQTKGDPSAGFGHSRKPTELSDEDYGRELYKSIRN